MKTVSAWGLVAFLLFLTLYIGALARFGVNRATPWGDEAHFHQTIVRFAEHPSLETLRTYNEMSTPLPFILYGLWGKAFGLGLPILRICSLVVATLTLGLVYWLFRLLLPNWLAILGVIFLALNPYFAGTSVFVFTDMLAVAFLTAGVIALIKGNGPALFLCCAGALLSRQYLVFFPLAMSLYCAIVYVFQRDRSYLKNLLWTLLSFAPLVGLMFFWGGLSPDCPRRANYLSLGWEWHPESFFLYISLLFVYVLPFSASLLYKKRHEIKVYWPILPFSFLYWVAPVQPSPFTLLETDYVTVGMLHRLLTRLFPKLVNEVIFYLFFLLGMVILGIHIRRLILQLRLKRIEVVVFLIIAHILFFVIMPFSYLWWEKYFLPLLPLSLILAWLVGVPISQKGERRLDQDNA